MRCISRRGAVGVLRQHEYVEKDVLSNDDHLETQEFEDDKEEKEEEE